MFDLPCGSSEKGETEEQTLCLEIMEEIGCSVIKYTNRRFKSVIFGDFTAQSGEQGVLQHNQHSYSPHTFTARSLHYGVDNFNV